MRKALVTGALFFGALSTSGFAADLPSIKGPPVYAPPPPPVFSWTGFYVGAEAGANFAHSGVDIPAYPSSFGIRDTSASVGGKIGYNYQISSFVVGVEGAGNAVFNSRSELSGGAFNELYHVRQDFAGDVVGKVGYAFDRVLVYAKGGAAFADLKNLEFILGGVPEANGNISNFRTGWTVGAGLDYALTDNWIIGVDYAHADFGTGHYLYAGPVNVHHFTDAVEASISYKFGFAPPPAPPIVTKY